MRTLLNEFSKNFQIFNTMKLQAEYARIKGYTELWISRQGGIDKVKEYVEKVRKEGNYQDFNVRVRDVG